MSFDDIAADIMGRNNTHGSDAIWSRRFSSWFGVGSCVCTVIWNALVVSGCTQFEGCSAHSKHLLWALYFLNQYDTEAVNASVMGVDEKTFRRWAWFYLEGIAKMDKRYVRTTLTRCYFSHLILTSYMIPCSVVPTFQIIWENRYRGDTGEMCLVTVDGTDCQICEPTNFSKGWYSHKFHGPGLRYELGVSIKTGGIVSYNGPFPCGEFPDITIFRLGIRRKLGPKEKVIEDRGYKGDVKVCTPDDWKNQQHRKAMGKARARHETLNGRLKKWQSLGNVYRHSIHKHHLVFRAIIVIEQMNIENGSILFQVGNYRDSALIPDRFL